ncbi:hypothetical protein M9H77_18914 [Catharanthus roseus]|uniref:Uncharacterized protein n=1 Tax=Catharanthus roseus TaxID=4058 RepID=A0ACC0B8S1_CATRO|nr:hypothetical protein M9H77_18914 [Catharanthus roseus]
MGELLLWNRTLVWCLAGIDYEMPELGSGDLILGSGPCPWSLIVALHVSLNSGIEAALMCLDSLRLPKCARNPHIGSSISFVKIIKENMPYSAVVNLVAGLGVLHLKIGCPKTKNGRPKSLRKKKL